MKHKHHKIPKHMGGSNDPSNIVELTIEEHADAHRLLFEQHGHHQDYLAWQGLAKLKTRKELFSAFGQVGVRSRPTNKGKTYRYTKQVRGSTQGMKWFHDPADPSRKTCVSDEGAAPDGWIRGQGRKAINPGLNFHSKLR